MPLSCGRRDVRNDGWTTPTAQKGIERVVPRRLGRNGVSPGRLLLAVVYMQAAAPVGTRPAMFQSSSGPVRDGSRSESGVQPSLPSCREREERRAIRTMPGVWAMAIGVTNYAPCKIRAKYLRMPALRLFFSVARQIGERGAHMRSVTGLDDRRRACHACRRDERYVSHRDHLSAPLCRFSSFDESGVLSHIAKYREC